MSVFAETVFPRQPKRKDSSRYRVQWLLAHYPLPRLRAVLTPLFWLKRFPVHAAAGGKA